MSNATHATQATEARDVTDVTGLPPGGLPLAAEDRRWLTLTDEQLDVELLDLPGDAEQPPAVELRGHRDEERDRHGTADLCRAFVDAFNARDLDALVELVTDDVEFADAASEGQDAFVGEVAAIWDHAPQVVLTTGEDADGPCAVAWRPDEEGGWSRAALLCFNVDGELIAYIGLPDDPAALAEVATGDPSDDDLPEWCDWAGWDRGEERTPQHR